MENQSNTINKRYDFVFLFDVQDGNPNGDPDAGNLPRVDPETGMGLVTDVALKRKVRNYIQMVSQKAGYDIFVKERSILNRFIDEAHEDPEVKSKKKGVDKTEAARLFMCRKFYDVRTFGAVMSTGKNAGQVRGPVQLTFSRSVDPIITLEHSITRVAATEEKKEDKKAAAKAAENGEEAEEKARMNQTMGRKFTVPYALYRCHGFISPHFAKSTEFSEKDLELFWNALINMFDHDHSASRGQMNARALIVFEHDSELGCAPAHKLFDTVKVRAKTPDQPIRSYDDYEVVYSDGDAETPVSDDAYQLDAGKFKGVTVRNLI